MPADEDCASPAIRPIFPVASLSTSAPSVAADLFLSVCGCTVSVSCFDPEARQWLAAGYGRMLVPHGGAAAVVYHVRRDDGNALVCSREDPAEPWVAQDAADFLYCFDKNLGIELQRRRPDLFFVHAAAVEWQERVVLLAAPSGTGKSTLALALLHAGFGYLSDELAPVDPVALKVSPYPHALCLKAEPPAPYRLPADTLRTRRTLHIPVERLPSGAGSAPLPLAVLFFVQRHGASAVPIRRLDIAEAAARLYANALNPLAHSGDGLDAALAIARAAPAYALDASDLAAAVATVQQVLS